MEFVLDDDSNARIVARLEELSLRLGSGDGAPNDLQPPQQRTAAFDISVVAETPSATATVESHLRDRALAATIASPTMVRYRGDPLLYVGQDLADRLTPGVMERCEIDTAAALSADDGSQRCSFGAAMKARHFHLPADRVFLNAGSYGAAPRCVLEARAAWGRLSTGDPVGFRASVLPFRMRQVQNRIAAFVGAHPADLQLMVNANTATSTVLKSLPWRVGDIVMYLSCDYDASKLAFRYLTDTFGVETDCVPLVLPMSDDEIVARLREHLAIKQQVGELPRLANFCHVTSRTAWIFPIKRIVALCHGFGVPVLVDGAQVPGHIALDIVDVGADYYVGTCHKWMFTCPGVAFLVVAPSKQPLIKPLAPLAHCDEPFETAFAETAEDPSVMLATLQAFDFVDRVCGGWANVWAYNSRLAQRAVEELTAMWGLDAEGMECIQLRQLYPGGRDATAGRVNCLPIVPLPGSLRKTERDAQQLFAQLLHFSNITSFIFVETFAEDGHEVPFLAVRITCQIHVSMDDVRKLGRAVLDVLSRGSDDRHTQDLDEAHFSVV
jgi:isopenicillin-N epimerase